MKLCTLFSASHLPLFELYKETLPDDIKEVVIYFISDMFGGTFGGSECKEAAKRKLIFWNDLIQSGQEGDIIFYTDVDVIFNSSINLTENIEKLLTDYHILAQRNDPESFNTGVIAVKVCEITKLFFQHMYNERESVNGLQRNEQELMNNKSRAMAGLKILTVPDDIFYAKHFGYGLGDALPAQWLLFHCTCFNDCPSKVEFLNSVINNQNIKTKTPRSADTSSPAIGNI